MDSHLKALIIHELDNIAKAETENLVTTPKTMDDYLRVVGRVQGIRLAIEIIEEQYTNYLGG